MSAGAERGSATIAVTFFGALAVVIASSTAVRFVQEYRAIDDSLAEVRAYWAAIGHTNYALSRTTFSGSCKNTGCADGLRKSTAQAYLDEISALRTWTYPENGASYQITLLPTASSDPTPYGGHAGSLMIKTTFPSAGPVDGLRVVGKKSLRPIELRYCVALTSPSADCGTTSSSEPGWHHVTSVHRPIS